MVGKLFAFAFGLIAFVAATGWAGPFPEIESRLGGKIGVEAVDTATGRKIEYRHNERFPMCSTFKLLAVTAVLQRVDQGKEDLDHFISYSDADILEYAPVTKQHVAEGGMKLGDLCAAAIEQSDNTAGNLLLRAIGGPSGLTSFLRSISDKVTRSDRFEPELNKSGPGEERDTTAPAAMCSDVVKIFTTDLLSASSRDQLEQWLRRNETGEGMIRAAVPKDWLIGDKTGRSGDGTTNDVAIVRPPGQPPMIIAIYTRGPSASPAQRNAAIADTARAVLNEFRGSVKSAR